MLVSISKSYVVPRPQTDPYLRFPQYLWVAPWEAPSELLIEVLCNPSKIIYMVRVKHDISIHKHITYKHILKQKKAEKKHLFV